MRPQRTSAALSAHTTSDTLTTPPCSRLFAKNGYRIALIARNEAQLTSLADEINKDGGEVSVPSSVRTPVATYPHPLTH